MTTELKCGDLVRFNHERDGGPVRRIASVAPDGMVELEDMGGFFAPHLFEIADDIANIPTPARRYVDPEDILEGAQQRLMEQGACECPKCGRLHHKLASNPPKAIAGSGSLHNPHKLREALERIAILSADVGGDGWGMGAPKAYAHCARIARDALAEDDSLGRGLSSHFAEPTRSLPTEGNASVHSLKERKP